MRKYVNFVSCKFDISLNEKLPQRGFLFHKAFWKFYALVLFIFSTSMRWGICHQASMQIYATYSIHQFRCVHMTTTFDRLCKLLSYHLNLSRKCCKKSLLVDPIHLRIWSHHKEVSICLTSASFSFWSLFGDNLMSFCTLFWNTPTKTRFLKSLVDHWISANPPPLELL